MYALMIYSLKVGACLAVFYLFFKLLLSRETFHRLNRIVVLAAMVLSFILPFCVITIYRELPAAPECTGLPFKPLAEPFARPLFRSARPLRLFVTLAAAFLSFQKKNVPAAINRMPSRSSTALPGPWNREKPELENV